MCALTDFPVSPPARSECLFTYFYGLNRVSAKGELSWFGDGLTLSNPDDDEREPIEFSRE